MSHCTEHMKQRQRGFQPNVANTCLARNVTFWLEQLWRHLDKVPGIEKALDSLLLIENGIAYMADASAEAVRNSACSTSLVNVARRALWLKTWEGDYASKNKLCIIPFDGSLLFGSELENVLER